MTFNPDRTGACILLTFSCAYAMLALDIPTTTTQLGSAFSARTMPLALAVVGIILSLSLLLFPGKAQSNHNAPIYWMKGVAFIGLMSVYGLTLRALGFIVATSAFLAIGFWLLGERKIIALVALPAGVATVFWFLLSELLGVYIAPGPALWSEYV